MCYFRAEMSREAVWVGSIGVGQANPGQEGGLGGGVFSFSTESLQGADGGHPFHAGSLELGSLWSPGSGVCLCSSPQNGRTVVFFSFP